MSVVQTICGAPGTQQSPAGLSFLKATHPLPEDEQGAVRPQVGEHRRLWAREETASIG